VAWYGTRNSFDEGGILMSLCAAILLNKF